MVPRGKTAGNTSLAMCFSRVFAPSETFGHCIRKKRLNFSTFHPFFLFSHFHEWKRRKHSCPFFDCVLLNCPQRLFAPFLNCIFSYYSRRLSLLNCHIIRVFRKRIIHTQIGDSKLNWVWTEGSCWHTVSHYTSSKLIIDNKEFCSRVRKGSGHSPWKTLKNDLTAFIMFPFVFYLTVDRSQNEIVHFQPSMKFLYI